ncbi:MAG: transposase [Pelatocladus maniniholoensis HA4357-MV3]|uniref:Transposase n=1 Tax=Pelatocladus maniniholoensis HA4357-MV3 TaxID=1117104 RepID=A0A9E3HC14_9NOST|nr:transposase [Pelatocladus maniniholoensis HA4357-MV3]
MKAQLVVDQVSGKIICTAYGIGRIHDFRLLKNTKVRFHDSQLCLADKGYQGIAKIHAISCIPAKKPRGANLSPANRQHNRNLAQLRIVGEHINRRLKIFRILKEQYRNRRKRFGLRCNLIAGLLNYELALFS